jgi:hypothetical protein
MRRALLLLALVTITALAPLAQAGRKLSLESVTIDLPFGDRQFNGPGSDAINGNCLVCHSAGMILNQPALSEAQWRAEVDKMRNSYKAPVDPKDVESIVEYLVALQGAR